MSAVTVAELHRLVTDERTRRDRGSVSERDPMMGQGHHFGGLDRVGEHWLQVRRRGVPWSAEMTPPIGQAALWCQDVIREVSRSGQHVARQIARLCGDDSQVVIPWRSLADAVGIADKGGRLRAYTERGAEALVEAGWLRVETTGRGRGAATTFYLLPG